MKKALLILTVITLVALGVVGIGLAMGEQQADKLAGYETEQVQRETLFTIIEANGVVQSNQSALLLWKTSGEVETVFVESGAEVSKGDILASLDTASLPTYIIAAQAELVTSRRALDNLMNSESQQAQALKAVNDAEKALEDALHPETLQAQALSNLAEAREALETAERNYTIATAPTPQSAIEQAYSNLLLAEYKISQTEEALEKAHNQDTRAAANKDILSPEMIQRIRGNIRELIKQLEFVLIQDRLAYEKSLARYNALIAPPDPLDVAVAESELAFAEATLADAQREWEKIKDGFNPADIAVLEAELDDAMREWERIKDGPHPDDIAVLETKIAAAEAALTQVNIVAPFDGTVTHVKTQEHDIVDLGTLALQFDDISKLYVNLTISEVDVNRIKIGQDVTLTFDAVPTKEYQGEITKIAMVGTKFLGATSFRVLAEILEPDDDIRPGMTSSIQIIVNKVNDVITVPGQAIRGLNGELVVYRLSESGGSQLPVLRWEQDQGVGGGFKFPLVFEDTFAYELQPITITLGTTTNYYTEINGGDLQVGDLIVLNPPGE
jgi:HlyD family secretion protein